MTSCMTVIDTNILISLTKRYSLSHWDSMLLGACMEARVDKLYTEDIRALVIIDGIALDAQLPRPNDHRLLSSKASISASRS